MPNALHSSKMSPIDAGRVIGKESIENHPLIEAIKSGAQVPPSLMRGYGFETAVKPHTLAGAVYRWEKGRHTGDPEILHPANTYVRDSVWDLKVGNSDPDQGITIYSHDMPEKLSMRNVGGSYGMARWLGMLFGEHHEGIALSLTNIRNNAIFKELEYRILEERIRAPSADDVYGIVRNVRKNAGSKRQQVRVYVDLVDRMRSYLLEMDTFGWGRDDMVEAREFLGEALKHAEALADNPIPQLEIKRRSSPYFDDIVNDAAHLIESPSDFGGNAHSLKRPDCVLNMAENESELMHMLDHVEYERYARDLFNFSVAMLGNQKLARYSHVPIVTKLLEDADNVRKQPKLNQYQQHMTYSKAKLWIDVGDQYTNVLRRANDPRAQIVEYANKFLKTELLFRVITDVSQVTAQRDKDYRQHLRWLAVQFSEIRLYVGENIEAKVLKEIQALTKSRDDIERQTGENLNLAYANLAREPINGFGPGKNAFRRFLSSLDPRRRGFGLW